MDNKHLLVKRLSKIILEVFGFFVFSLVLSSPVFAVTFTANGGQNVQTGSIQNYTVPSTGSYTIEAWGAGGGYASSYTSYPGRGAYIKGTVSLTAGQVLKILVGQQGGNGSYGGGGGGGTYITDNSNNPYIVAGGGGGAQTTNNNPSVSDASTTTSGVSNAYASGGSGGGGGGAYPYGGGGGGAMLGSGGSGYGTGGGLWTGGSGGGNACSPGAAGVGGYGGGGGGEWCYGGSSGGGGGYSGGAGGYSSVVGGGGGSYNGGTNQTNTAGVQTGNGQVIITTAAGAASATTTGNSGYSYNYFFSAGTVTNNTGNTAWYGTAWGAGSGYSGTACSALPNRTDYTTIGTGTNNQNIAAYVTASASTVYYFCVYVKDSGNVYYYSPTTSTLTTPAITAPSIQSPTKTSITSTTATLGGNPTSDNGGAITGRGVCVGTSVNPALGGTCFSTSGTTGVFTVNATSLTASTLYHYRAYATNSVGTSYTTDDTFTTTNIPSISSPTKTNITTTTATLGGNVTSDGGATISERGVCTALTSNPGFTSQTFNANGSAQTGTIQTYSVPSTGSYTIEAWGAGGAVNACLGGVVGGLGAYTKGTFSLTAGQQLKVLVGQAGSNTSSRAGGGGGSFVTDASNNPLAIAGGGGGGGSSCASGQQNASTSTSGLNATDARDGKGGINGGGGGGGDSGSGGGGGGLLSAGGTGCIGAYAGSGGAGGNGATAGSNGGCGSSYVAYGGAAFTTGGTGGAASANGGYGGGGSAYAWNCGGGGGGGYSGGGGGGYSSGHSCGGGGGTYNGGTNVTTTANQLSGNGKVVISSTPTGTTCTSTTGTTGVFTVNVTGLPSGTVHYRAYAKNSEGSAFTTDDTFVTVNNPPSITVNPAVTYGAYTRTSASANWTLNFTATDAEQTGAGALTYYVHTGAGRTGTQVATETFTSGGAVAASLAYNATGLVDGSNTLYLSVYDGSNYSATNPSFTLLRDSSVPNAATPISTTPSNVGGDNQYTVTFTSTDTYSTNTNELAYNVRTAAAGGGTLLASGTATSGTSKTTAGVTDSTLAVGANTRYVRVCDGGSNCTDTSFTVTKPLPTVTTTSVAGVDTQYATFNGTVNPNNYGNATGYFRWGTSNIACDNVAGTRYPSTGGTSIANGASPVAFSMPLPGGTLSPGTTYYYCAYASNANGVGMSSSNATFTTPTATAGCAAPATGSFQITSSCYFPLAYDGVDAGSGTQNTAQFTIPAGFTFNVGNAIPNQVIAFGVLYKPTGATIVRFAGSQLRRGAIWVPDADGDGYPDSANPTYTVNTAQPVGYVRRTALASNLSVADCSTNNGNTWQNIGNLVKDADNDGYKTSAAAASQCVGNTSSINGRTYYKDSTGAYTWMDAASALGGGVTDCNDAGAVPCAPTGGSAAVASQTQMNVSWSAGTGPAATSYNLVWCTGASCTPSTTITGVTSVYAHTGRTCGTTYGYNVIAVNASGSSSASSTFYGTTSSCASAPTVYTDAPLNITGTSAMLEMRVNPNGATTSDTFRYGTSNVACSSLPSTIAATANLTGNTLQSDAVQLSGLTGGTTYYYCATANNSQGTTYGVVTSFTTSVTPIQVYTDNIAWVNASMVVPSDGIPLFITVKGLYKCTTAACTAFTLVNTTYTSYNKASDHQIAIGTDGLPIVVRDGGYVYKCSNVSCTAGTEYFTATAYTWLGIAVPADGLPIIAYNSNGTVSAYKCATSSCSSGSAVSIYASQEGPAGAAVTVIIAGDGLPVIAFGRDNYGIQVIHCGNASCSSGNSSTLLHNWYNGTNGIAFYPYISIDKGTDGYPILAYVNSYNSCSASGNCTPYIYKCSNYACTAGSEGSAGGTYMLNPSIRVATDGLPVIGINGWNANTQIAKVIKCGNNACSAGNTSTTYRTSAQCGYIQSWGSAIGLNSSNIPYYFFTGSCNTAPYTGGFMLKCANTTCN